MAATNAKSHENKENFENFKKKIVLTEDDVPGASFKNKDPQIFHHEPRVVQYSQIDSIGVSGDEKGLHWYQWYDRYQWKSTLFQWFYW